MEDNYDVLSVSYCSKCFAPITDDDRDTCPVCGEPLVPIGLDERMKRDADIGKPIKILFTISKIVFAAAYAVNLAYCIAGIVKCASGEKIEPVKSAMIGHDISSFQPIWYYGMGFSVFFSVITLIVLVYGIWNTVRKNSKGMAMFMGVGANMSVFMLFTRNFYGFALAIGAVLLFAIPDMLIRSKKLKEKRFKRICKKYSAMGSKEWRCDNCGYINDRRDNECKSCGKYK